jgi:hypothetical protein
MGRSRSQIFLSILILIGSQITMISGAQAGIFGPNCKKVHPQGMKLKSEITKYYTSMTNNFSARNYDKAYAAYKLLNKKNNSFSNLMSQDKNYRCFLDANYESSTYAWFQSYQGATYGGKTKSICQLWGLNCPAKKPNYYLNDPCAEFTLTRDYVDCIEDNARPDYSGYVD